MKLRNPEIRIETTAKCNANCTICPREQMTRPKAIMPLSHFMDLVDQAIDIGADTISLFGHGEPLTDYVLEEKIDYCRENGLSTFITSNAGILTYKRAKSLINAGLNHIRFSVHGFYGDYESVHRGLKWDTVIENIANFINNKRKCKVSISVIPMAGETEKTIREFWDTKNIDFLEIWKPHNWCYGQNNRQVNQRKRTCGRPESGPVQIQADGKMIVCCFDFNGKMIVGNTYNNTIEEILKSKQFDFIRDKHAAGDMEGLICKECDQLNIEEVSPLLYSSRDASREVGKTSSTKYKMMEA
jgi:radical SAM protein with 4Fe4S-binding SPASM domain